MQFRIIVIADPQTNKQTQTGPITIHCATAIEKLSRKEAIGKERLVKIDNLSAAFRFFAVFANRQTLKATISLFSCLQTLFPITKLSALSKQQNCSFDASTSIYKKNWGMISTSRHIKYWYAIHAKTIKASFTWWRFSVAVTRWSRSTQSLYIEPG